MPLNTLEQRFQDRAKSIYDRFSNKESLTEIKPNTQESRSRIKNDSQLLPVVSTARDIKLLSKFLASDKGLLFLGKQTLLQTGNTFAETRLYNPLGTLINAVPTVYAARHIGKSLTAPTRDDRGALQSETVATLTQAQSGGLISRLKRGVASAAMSPIRALTYKPDYKRPEDVVFSVDGPLLSEMVAKELRGNPKGTPYGNGRTKYGTVGQIEDNNFPVFSLGPNGNKQSLLSNLQVVRAKSISNKRLNGLNNQKYSFDNDYIANIGKGSAFVVADSVGTSAVTSTVTSGRVISLGLRGTPSDRTTFGKVEIVPAKGATGKPIVADITKLSPKFTERFEQYTAQTVDGTAKGTTFAGLIRNRQDNPYFRSSKQFTDGFYGDNAALARDEDKLYKSTIKDPYNLGVFAGTEKEKTQLSNGKVVYSSIVRTDETDKVEGKSDIIKFIFRSADNSDPVHFRAFISAFNESVKPEFNEQKYLGRTERFVTYAGAKRTATLNFNIVAFSATELDNMWLRINYLAGLAFPKGVSQGGFMIPPLFKLTVGKIYENQPCYVETLDFDFLDDKITFDIEAEVSQVINVKMTVSLLEKTTRFYNSPFYAISQEIANSQLVVMNPPATPTFAPPLVLTETSEFVESNAAARQRLEAARISSQRRMVPTGTDRRTTRYQPKLPIPG